jgi:uncharacterized protein (TIGR03435 family)
MVRAIYLVMILTLSYATFGQSLAKAPEFEVADIKLNHGSGDAGRIQILPGGQVNLPNITLKSLIMLSYGLNEDMLRGAPSWIDTDHYDIVAKAPPGTSRDGVRAMVQSLLADRFKLTIHREDKPAEVYEMVVAKSGPKLQKASGGPQQCRWNSAAAGMVQRECHNMTMVELASSLPNWGPKVDLPVVDLTGIQGAFDFTLTWNTSVGDAGNADAAADAAGNAIDHGGSILDAMEQIGLKLERRKRSISVVVIDHVERTPTPN